MYLRVAACTDVGRVRKNNEDAFVVANLDEDAPATVSGARRIGVGERGLLLAVSDAMGRTKRWKVALARLSLRSRDCLLLCSDGLTRHVSDDEIRDILLPAPRLDAACKTLVDLANERGGADNITVMVAGVGGTTEAAL